VALVDVVVRDGIGVAVYTCVELVAVAFWAGIGVEEAIAD
jgi:hypothetical protein